MPFLGRQEPFSSLSKALGAIAIQDHGVVNVRRRLVAAVEDASTVHPPVTSKEAGEKKCQAASVHRDGHRALGHRLHQGVGVVLLDVHMPCDARLGWPIDGTIRGLALESSQVEYTEHDLVHPRGILGSQT